MVESLVNSSINLITKYHECDERKLIILRYGLSGFYKSFIKILVAFMLCIIFGLYKEFLLLLLFYSTIKRYSYGLHAKSSLSCWIVTLCIYTVGPYLISKVNIPLIVLISIWAVCFISFVLWAPADTPKRPLIRKNNRIKQKIKTCLISIFYLIIILVMKEGISVLALIVQATIINPLLYWITKTPFNNYKNYKKKERS